jgi:hypothetical protein
MPEIPEKPTTYNFTCQTEARPFVLAQVGKRAEEQNFPHFHVASVRPYGKVSRERMDTEGQPSRKRVSGGVILQEQQVVATTKY